MAPPPLLHSFLQKGISHLGKLDTVIISCRMKKWWCLTETFPRVRDVTVGHGGGDSTVETNSLTVLGTWLINPFTYSPIWAKLGLWESDVNSQVEKVPKEKD